MRQVRKLQHQLIALGVAFGDFLIELSDAITEFAGFLFLRLGSSVFFCPINAPISFDTRLRCD